MRYLFTNDFHFCRRNPASRTDDYNAELFGLLDQLYQLVEAFEVRAVLIAGDIFHDKGSAAWDVVIRLLAWAQRVREAECELITVMGNHDEIHDRYESIWQSPYGALISSGLFQDVSRTLYLLHGGPAVYGVPWPDGAKPDAFAAIPPEADIVLAHGFATPEGGEKWNTFCHRYDDLAVQAPHVRLWHFGHDHTDHGVYRLRNGAKVMNIGALSRGILDYDSIIRQVKVALVDFDPEAAEHEVQQVGLQQQPAEAIFDLERRRERLAEQEHLQGFLDQLATGMAGVLDVDYHAVLARLPLDVAVRAKVEHYLAQAEAAR